MCNLYSMTSNKDAIRELARFMKATSAVDNLQAMPAIFANGWGPVVRNTSEGRELAMTRWGMPSPKFALEGKSYDSGVTNVRNTASPHWRRYLGVESRCVVPATSFCEPDQASGSKQNTWFALDETRPLFFFAGIWTPQWTSVRKMKDGETTDDLYAFLTTEANAEVKAIHPKAMPVFLRNAEEVETWLTAPTEEALKLQRPLPDAALKIVARGTKLDRPGDDNGQAPSPAQASLF
ncbi:SOS response-associated peptidase [Asticcacaulis sp. EMRT-3]|uniref:SOS response-associated peptidase n=1 Tax=Asticcacaulis sp. EMRT-3 TaxID=3040349 RepID=UPI0024AFCE27|nr:SOS response-associated peptidase [Asticcacaulis sp. EMRT-3]MDI7776606.1 SOS response-associated peptidase [Asticcacaulis sp. EMRT-3]